MTPSGEHIVEERNYKFYFNKNGHSPRESAADDAIKLFVNTNLRAIYYASKDFLYSPHQPENCELVLESTTLIRASGS